jgi:hypothetical protein
VRLRREAAGLEQDAAFLPDGRHAGTLLQGMLAQLLLQAIDRQIDPPLPPLNGVEIVDFADAMARQGSAVVPVITVGTVPGEGLKSP